MEGSQIQEAYLGGTAIKEESFIIRGRILKYGDNIDTDAIFRGEYIGLNNEVLIAKHAMEGLDPNFYDKVRKGYCIIVAGVNFGCGSSREQAPLSLKLAGIRLILANSIARIFFRNSINISLPALIYEGDINTFQDGAEIIVDVRNGQITDLTSQRHLQTQPLAEHILSILKEGGLTNYIKALKKNDNAHARS